MQTATIAALLLTAALQQAAVNPDNPTTRADFEAGDTTREPYQRATDLLQTLRIGRGAIVADVGAGAGYYAMRLSAIVGSTGKVCLLKTLSHAGARR